MMVAQARSDWGDNWKWPSQELQELWVKIPEVERKRFRRGLLIDWGFATVEKVNDDVVLTEEDVKIYHPTQWVAPSLNINVVDREKDTMRHCIPGDHKLKQAEYSIPPLWELNNDMNIDSMNTHILTAGARDGQVNVEWVNEVLGKEKHSLTNAMVRDLWSSRDHG